jgi:hypothetical protein
MTDPTSLSTPQSQSDEVDPLKTNLPSQSPEDLNLLDIPILKRGTILGASIIKSGEPSSCDTPPTTGIPDDTPPKYEYEFSSTHDGRPSFAYLYDTSDVSACERITHRPVKHEDISYSDTGNGFVVDGDGNKFTFTKQIFQRSWETHADIKAGVEYEAAQLRRKPKHQSTAADILASL